jgi:hypothetical protein
LKRFGGSTWIDGTRELMFEAFLYAFNGLQNDLFEKFMVENCGMSTCPDCFG